MMKQFTYLILCCTMLWLSGCSTDKTTDPTPGPADTHEDATANRWMDGIMSKLYLWNTEYNTLKHDYNQPYDKFLLSGLEGVMAQGRINADDGYQIKNSWYYYSNVQRKAVSTSSANHTRVNEPETTSGFGIYNATGVDSHFLALLGIIPGSPAALAGLSRGDLIAGVMVDGQRLDVNAAWAQLVYPTKSATLIMGKKTWVNDHYQLSETTETKTLNIATFNYNPFWEKQILTATDGRKIGYLAYMSFHMAYDAELIATFQEFKSAGITDLILDLRYNGGGHVVSSTVLGTLLAGQNHKEEVYCKTTYNADRNKIEAPGIYRIGQAISPGINYPLLAQALQSSLGLRRVFILATQATASASELVINGLRGLDIEVNLIGATTNGKNVGMEVSRTNNLYNGYSYTFAPITFYSANAKDYRDYGDGFNPDLAVEELDYMPEDFGRITEESDPLTTLAYRWIDTGKKPILNRSRGVNTHAIKSITRPVKQPFGGSIVFRNKQ